MQVSLKSNICQSIAFTVYLDTHNIRINLLIFNFVETNSVLFAFLRALNLDLQHLCRLHIQRYFVEAN
jgi:glutamate formiminotransferase